MLLPACTGTGFAEFVTDTSTVLPTGMLTPELLFPLLGSLVDDETDSVCVMTVPVATFEFTFTTNVKFAVVVEAILVVSVQVRLARTQVHPAGPVSETPVVFAGNVSVMTGAFAVAGPAFFTVCVYVMLLPAVAGLGLPVFVTLKSACAPDATAIFTVDELSPGFVSRVV